MTGNSSRPTAALTSAATVLVITVAAIAAANTAHAQTIHVPSDYPTIQQAINAASNSYEIIVAPGTYNEAINFLGKAVHLRSSGGPDVTTIDAPGSNVTVVTCDTGEGPDTILEGFTITGGFTWGSGGGMRNINASPTITNCVFSGNIAEGHGGGMFNMNSSPTINGCTFIGNWAEYFGGAMANLNNSNPKVTECTFIDNSAWDFGGGMSNRDNSNPTLDNCTFINNSACDGGGMVNWDGSNPILSNCVFTANTAHCSGGGIANGINSSPTLTACRFEGNSADSDFGGGMSNWIDSHPTLTDCVFTGNYAGYKGGGMYNGSNSNPVLTGCQFTDNTVEWGGGGGIANSNSSSTLIGCVIAGNSAGEPGGGMWSSPESLPQFGTTLFCENEPDQLFGPWEGLGGNEFLEECPDPPGDTCPWDFNGDGVVNGADLGQLLANWGECSECDPPENCPWDFNNDCVVNGADLGQLLANWGDCPDPPPPPTGACCIDDGCEQWTESECVLAGGAFLGVGIDCEDDPCAEYCKPYWDYTIGQPGMGGNISSIAVRALTEFNGQLIAGGRFESAGDVSANHIARWDGSQWEPLGYGVGGVDWPNVYTLAVHNDGTGDALYVGGNFFTPYVHIARWNGSQWSKLNAGWNLNAPVHALATFDDGTGDALYVLGSFDEAGGQPANNIAKWDGSTWSPVGEGLAPIFGGGALAVFDDGNGPALFAGGKFTTAGGQPANNIAKWDGQQWSPLGEGTDNWVLAFAVFDDGSGDGPALYVGGDFETAGGQPASGVARWDGERWSPVGEGLVGVRTLGVFDDGDGPALYAGGGFTVNGGYPGDRIAKWDGSKWQSVAGGTGQYWVYALAEFDDGSESGPALYVGGDFGTAGGQPANRIAALYGCPADDTVPSGRPR